MAAAARAHRSLPPIAAYLVEQGYLIPTDGMLFIGPEAERRFGHRHFMNLMAVFTAPPEFTVLHGRDEIGRVIPAALRPGGWSAAAAARRPVLAGDMDGLEAAALLRRARRGRRPCTMAVRRVGGLSFEIARSMRDVLLGGDARVTDSPGFRSAGRFAQRRHRPRARRRDW